MRSNTDFDADNASSKGFTLTQEQIDSMPDATPSYNGLKNKSGNVNDQAAHGGYPG